MTDSQKQPDTTSLNNTAAPSDSAAQPKGNRNPDAGAWADEKATANAKHDRAAAPSKGEPLGDALAVGGGQQSTPYQLETQADAIAKQTKRGNV